MESITSTFSSYTKFISNCLIPFSITRVMPFITGSMVTLYLSNADFDALSFFGYLMAVFSMATTFFSMPLLMTANIVVTEISMHQKPPSFMSGLTVAAIFGLAAMAVNVLMYGFVADLDRFAWLNKDTSDYLVALYLPSTFFLIINNYSYIYLEGIGLHKKVSVFKTVSSVFSILSVVLVYILNDKPESSMHILSVFLVFLFTEILFSILLFYTAVKNKLFCFRPQKNILNDSREIFQKIIRLGAPVSIGMTVQKLTFYFINAKMLYLGAEYVALLTIFGSIANFFQIPLTSFTQANSLYISGNQNFAKADFYKSLQFVFVIFICVTGIGFFIWDFLLSLFSVGNLPFSKDSLFVILSFFVFANGLVSLAASSFRGLNRTLMPQIILNTVMMLLFVPIITFDFFGELGFLEILSVQSFFLCFSGLLLLYIFYSNLKGD